MNPNKLERQESKRIIKDYWQSPMNSKGINFAVLSNKKVAEVKQMSQELLGDNFPVYKKEAEKK